MKTVKRMITLLTAALVLALMPAMVFAESSDVFYVRDSIGRVYQSGETLRIGNNASGKITIELIQDYDKTEGMNVSPIIGFYEGIPDEAGELHGDLSDAGFDVKTDSNTIEINAAGMEIGKKATLGYSLYKWDGTAAEFFEALGKGEFEFANAPRAYENTLNVEVVPGNPLAVSKNTAAVRYSKLKKAKQTVSVSKLVRVSKAEGPVSYKLTGAKKGISFNAKTKKVTVKKGMKKGSYTLTFKVTAAGSDSCGAGSKTVKAKLVIK